MIRRHFLIAAALTGSALIVISASSIHAQGGPVNTGSVNTGSINTGSINTGSINTGSVKIGWAAGSITPDNSLNDAALRISGSTLVV